MRAFTVLILPPDVFSVSSLCHHVEVVHPGANCLLATTVQQARFIILSEQVDLFVTGMDMADGDVLDLLHECLQPIRRLGSILVLTGRNAPRLLLSLRSLKVEGVFDSAGEHPAVLENTMRALAHGRPAWSHIFLASLVSAESRMIQHQLTPREQLGLAIMGDGCSDRSVAERLGMQLSSVRSMRHEIYTKVEAHGTEDIVRIAAQLGYTRFGLRGLIVLGLSVLVREYETRSKRPTALPPALLQGCGLGVSPAVPSGNSSGEKRA